ncbi:MULTISPECIES: bifunctional serine/threonine-protein kinase/transporter substrate-binding domain-containing protein [unclassified Mycolicibacterium]|uniref:bifunctional serine/threonine-protein kinase/transporter substrate-binding domain-containing protein n=1 Tax=unclassified Mycolicibacterium TaxID=2636767 RepID=UPI002EDB20F6
MVGDLFTTQRDEGDPLPALLAAAGFERARQIGRGGFGVVYRCVQTELDRVVAVKVLTADLEDNRPRFIREQQAMARLTGHPNIVPVLQVGQTDRGQPFLVMPFYPRGSLHARIFQDGVVALDDALHIGVKLAGALDCAHRQNIVHRDVKPANILLTDYGEPALSDFGIAHFAGGFETATGVFTGSPAYTAPEVLSGHCAGAASDVYGLGATLFTALTGHAAFERLDGEQVVAQFVRITTGPEPDLGRHGVPAEVAEVVARTMARDPGVRPTAAELGEQLRRLQARHSTAERPAPEPDRTNPVRRRTLTGAAAVLLVSAIVFGVLHWWGGSGRADGGTPPNLAAEADGVVPEIAATLPAGIKSAGRLVIGVEVPYAPLEFKNSAGQIVGFDVDLMTAVARTLGVIPDYRDVAAFEDIIPEVQRGTLTVGASAITDTREREHAVDFVTYFQAGTLWAQRAGPPIDPNAACGLKVGVQSGSLQATDQIPAKSDACVATGLKPIEKVVFTLHNELTAALINGQIDAMAADSPATAFAIKLSTGRLVAAGVVTDVAPYGWTVGKGSGLSQPLLRALQYLMQTGEYRTIAAKWGIESGMIDKPVIDGATA